MTRLGFPQTRTVDKWTAGQCRQQLTEFSLPAYTAATIEFVLVIIIIIIIKRILLKCH